MKKIGLVNQIFGKFKNKVLSTFVKGINQTDTSFTDWNGGMYDNDIAKSAIHTNASNIAKLRPKHIRRSKDKVIYFPDKNIEKMLNYPNRYMNMYDFLYKVATQREEKDNAFIYFKKDSYELFPISASKLELLEDTTGALFARFYFKVGDTVVIPFEDLIIIRNHFNSKDLFGDNNNTLNSTMQVVNTIDQGIVNAIKKSANLRGILKWNSVLRDEDIEKQTKKFVDSYLNINNDGGVASTDPRFEFEQLKQESYVPNKQQMDSSKERIYSYFGVNEKIIQSRFSEEEWNAYYENKIEPVAIQLSLEFTKKIFTNHKVGHGNEIIFEANRLQYASNTTKVQVAKLLTDIGAASLDDILEIFNMAPIGGEEGKRRVQTLNMVNANKADKYQVGEGGETDNDRKEDE